MLALLLVPGLASSIIYHHDTNLGSTIQYQQLYLQYANPENITGV
jgi:hypothetical protein